MSLPDKIVIIQNMLQYILPTKIKNGGNYRDIVFRIKTMASVMSDWKSLLIGDLQFDLFDTPPVQNEDILGDIFDVNPQKHDIIEKEEDRMTKYVWVEWGLTSNDALIFFAKNGITFGVINNFKYNNKRNHAVDNDGNNIIMLASMNGYVDIVEFMIDYFKKTDVNNDIIRDNQNINKINKNNKTALMLAISAASTNVTTSTTFSNYKKIIHLLINNGASVNYYPYTKTIQPLMLAVRSGNKEIVEILVKNKVKITDYANDAFKVACVSGNREIIKLLIETTYDPHWSGNLAYIIEYKDCVDLLLSKNKKELYASKDGKTALSLALSDRQKNKDIIKLLLEYDDPNNSINLTAAISYNDKNVVKYLLERDVSPNAISDYPPLYNAMIRGHDEIFELLLEYGANPNSIDCPKNHFNKSDGATILSHSVEREKFEAVKSLLNCKRFDINFHRQGFVTLSLAACVIRYKHNKEYLSIVFNDIFYAKENSIEKRARMIDLLINNINFANMQLSDKQELANIIKAREIEAKACGDNDFSVIAKKIFDKIL
jgi:ankyrin repeat protein